MLKISRRRALALLTGLIIVLAAPLYLYAQEYRPHPDDWGGDDGRLNVNAYMDGIGVYCADETQTPADTIEDGGGFLVLAPHPDHPGGKEVLWVPKEDIDAGVTQVEETGQYATLGQAEGTWFDPQPAIYYLPSNEFQLNIVGGTTEELYEFQWTECRTVPKVTNDGCAPGSDRNERGVCVRENLY